ncbi:MAG: radical SAM protein, partial [Desulfobacterales bacterium]|nr:radical SAM protein [Desulfobacterales bacterium]
IQHPASRNRPFIIPIFIPHAGCPHQCVFCNQRSITGSKKKNMKPDQFCIQTREFLKYKKADRTPVQIAFFGGNFLGLKEKEIKSWLELANDFIHRGEVDSIRFSTRPDTIDSRRLDTIENYPVSTVELGIQSMDDQILALAGREQSASDSVRAVQRLKERHFSIGLQMMVGLPGDDESRSLMTAGRIVDLRPDFVRIYPTVVLKNSRLAEFYKKGDYTPLSLEEGVTLVKKIYLRFEKENINVIRMGLQASEDLEDESTVLAGPYHPAFGHLVHSEIFWDKVLTKIELTGCDKGSLTIFVNPRSISKMRGINNSNIKKLRNKFQLDSVAVMPDLSLGEDDLRLV